MRCDRHRFDAPPGDWQDRVDEPVREGRHGEFPEGIEQVTGAAVMAAQGILDLVIEPLIDLLAGLRRHGSGAQRPHDGAPIRERQSEA